MALLCLADTSKEGLKSLLTNVSTCCLQADKQQQQQQVDRTRAAQATAAQASHSGDQKASQSHGDQQPQPEASTSAAGSQSAPAGVGSQPRQQQQAEQRPPLQVYRSPKAVDSAAELPADVSVGSLRCVPHHCLPRLRGEEHSAMFSTRMQVIGPVTLIALDAGRQACRLKCTCLSCTVWPHCTCKMLLHGCCRKRVSTAMRAAVAASEASQHAAAHSSAAAQAATQASIHASR